MELKHRSHEIRFDENTEEWKCGSLALSNKSLKSLKAAIDREAKKRRTVAVPCLFLESRYYNDSADVHEATIVLLREGDRKADIKIDGRRGQEQVEIHELYALSEKKKLERYIKAKREASAAEQKVSDLRDELKSLTAEGIRELVAQKADADA